MPNTEHAKEVIRSCIGTCIMTEELYSIAHVADHLNDRRYTPIQRQDLDFFFVRDASVYISGLVIDAFISEKDYNKPVSFLKEVADQMSSKQFTKKTFSDLVGATIAHLIYCDCPEEAREFLKEFVETMPGCKKKACICYRELIAQEN